MYWKGRGRGASLRGPLGGKRTGDQTGEEGLAGKVGVVLLEVLLAGSDELDGSELEAAVLEAGDDGANEATLGNGVSILLVHCTVKLTHCSRDRAQLQGGRSGERTWTPSGLIAMKLFPTVSYTAFQC